MAKKRISARISESTKEHIERYAEVHGVTKGYLVEQALLHYLLALHELPGDMMIPPRITVTPASFAAVTRFIEKPRKPTKALRALLTGERR